jgi:hypothetical protein
MGTFSDALADRAALESQALEQNRILSIGAAGTAHIRGHVDTGERAAGNPIWVFEVDVTPADGEPYLVRHREIVSSAALGVYRDGSSIPCRIDRADPRKIAFGEQPFM